MRKSRRGRSLAGRAYVEEKNLSGRTYVEELMWKSGPLGPRKLVALIWPLGPAGMGTGIRSLYTAFSSTSVPLNPAFGSGGFGTDSDGGFSRRGK
jgi:hypothetical protein